MPIEWPDVWEEERTSDAMSDTTDEQVHSVADSEQIERLIRVVNSVKSEFDNNRNATFESISSLIKTVENIQYEINAQKDVLNNIGSMVKTVEDFKSKQERASEELNSSIKSALGAVNSKFDSQTNEFNKKIDEVESKVETRDTASIDIQGYLDQQIVKLLDEIKIIKNDFNVLQNNANPLESDIVKIKENLANIEKVSSDTRIEEREYELIGKVEELHKSIENIEALKTHFKSVADNLSDSSGKLINLKASLDEIAELKDSLDEIVDLKSSLDEIVELKDSLDEIVVDEIVELNNSFDEIVELKASLDEIVKLKDSLDEIVKLKDSISQIESLKKSLADISCDTLSKVQLEIADLRTTLDNTQKQISEQLNKLNMYQGDFQKNLKDATVLIDSVFKKIRNFDSGLNTENLNNVKNEVTTVFNEVLNVKHKQESIEHAICRIENRSSAFSFLNATSLINALSIILYATKYAAEQSLVGNVVLWLIISSIGSIVISSFVLFSKSVVNIKPVRGTCYAVTTILSIITLLVTIFPQCLFFLNK